MVIIENFATSKEVAILLDKARTVDWGEFNPNNFWENRIYNVLHDSDTKELCLDLIKRIRLAIIDHSDYKSIYPDCINIVRWSEGYEMPPHADAEEADGSTHPLYWRKFGCILYLNSDFEDGEIYFPNKNITLKPNPGTLVFFPGTIEWLHGVKETKNGIRYNLASFWTDDKSKEIIYDYSREQVNSNK